MTKQLLPFGILIFICACNPFDNFYTASSREDLWRIPLRKPYELITTASDSSETKSWNLKFLYNEFKGYIGHINVTQINLKDNYIYGHGQDIPAIAPNNYFLIRVDTKEELIFESFESWRAKLKSHSLPSEELYSPWTIFYPFRQKGKLPWN